MQHKYWVDVWMNLGNVLEAQLAKSEVQKAQKIEDFQVKLEKFDEIVRTKLEKKLRKIN